MMTDPGQPAERTQVNNAITFVRLSQIDLKEIAAHMSDPRVAAHMPLLTADWGAAATAAFVAQKEKYWARDGLGHWGILYDGRYVGWGGFQKALLYLTYPIGSPRYERQERKAPCRS